MSSVFGTLIHAEKRGFSFAFQRDQRFSASNDLIRIQVINDEPSRQLAGTSPARDRWGSGGDYRYKYVSRMAQAAG